MTLRIEQGNAQSDRRLAAAARRQALELGARIAAFHCCQHAMGRKQICRPSILNLRPARSMNGMNEFAGSETPPPPSALYVIAGK